jgi:hypothetical protein
MEMRIVVSEVEGTSVLAERLAAAFSPEPISLLSERQQVAVRVESAADHAVLRILETVDRWLDEMAGGSAEMWLGERSYRMNARWAPVETWQ